MEHLLQKSKYSIFHNTFKNLVFQRHQRRYYGVKGYRFLKMDIFNFISSCSVTRLTVMSPNIAGPLTLRTSPSDFATFNQIKSFLLFNIGLLLEKEKKEKSFHFMLSLLSRSGFWQKLDMLLKFLTVISNGPGFKLFTFNRVIDEVNC